MTERPHAGASGGVREADLSGVTERDGVRLSFEVFGDGPTTVVLMPTWSIIDSRFWKAQVGYLARHFREADDAARAATYLIRAGDEARALYADQEAIHHYREARRFLQQLGDDRRSRETLFKIALVHHLAFDYPAAEDAYDEAFACKVEPIVQVEITAPESAIGDITGDLSSRRGMVSGTGRGAPGTVVVRGQAPMSELLGYQSRLNALTSGQGRFLIEFSHYEAVPPNTQQQLVAGFRSRDAD